MNRNIYRDMRIVGVEDGAFSKEITEKTLLVAVLTRNKSIIDCLIDRIAVDGLDATDKLIQMLQKRNFDVILLAGVSFAGFNLIDPMELYAQFKKPVVVVTRTKPNNVAVKAALLKHFKDWQKRWSIFEKLGPFHKITVKLGEAPIFVEIVGAEQKWVCKVLRNATLTSRIPEPLRVARLIARGLTKNV